jgi:hypothetical protein
MSVGSNLQEMENVVTKGAAPAEPMPSSGIGYEDLGGPTPENYRPDDDSAALKTPGATLAQVKNVVNAKAMAAEQTEVEEEVIEEETEEEEDLDGGEEGGEEGEEETAEEEEVVEEDFNIEEDVNALLAGEELSEEFQEKARTIFEAAIKSRVAEIKESLQESYAAALVEELDAIKTQLTERVDSYLEYVADEWFF